MEISELHRGRPVDHIQLVAQDLSAARVFYEAVPKAQRRMLTGLRFARKEKR